MNTKKLIVGIDLAGSSKGSLSIASIGYQSESSYELLVLPNKFLVSGVKGLENKKIEELKEANFIKLVEKLPEDTKYLFDVPITDPKELINSFLAIKESQYYWELTKRPVDQKNKALRPIFSDLGVPVIKYNVFFKPHLTERQVVETYPGGSLKALFQDDNSADYKFTSGNILVNKQNKIIHLKNPNGRNIVTDPECKTTDPFLKKIQNFRKAYLKLNIVPTFPEHTKRNRLPENNKSFVDAYPIKGDHLDSIICTLSGFVELNSNNEIIHKLEQLDSKPVNVKFINNINKWEQELELFLQDPEDFKKTA